MKKIFVPAAIALLMAFGASDASAQSPSMGTGSESSSRPIPSNDERTPDKDAEFTNGRPMEQIRINETDSPRNRNKPQKDIGERKKKDMDRGREYDLQTDEKNRRKGNAVQETPNSNRSVDPSIQYDNNSNSQIREPARFRDNKNNTVR